MINENIAEFTKANIIKYQQMPIKKDVGAIVILDSNNRPRDNDNAEIVLDYFKKDNESGHNTRVVGVTREVALDARIITFNWFGSYKGQTIDWIINHKDEIAVINCSFSGTSDSDEQLKRLDGLHIPIVFASGNDGNLDNMNHEAQWDFTISIGAFKESTNNVETYSNGDELLDAVAFTWIYESVTDTKNHWFNGTSGAAPVASAMLWLYMSRSGQKFNLEQARAFIWRNTIDLYEEGHDNRSGYGLFRLPDEIERSTPMFNDINDRYDEAKEAIEWATEQGYLKGYADGTFRPTEPVTREQLAIILKRMNS